jgi:hypothetical protein
MVAKRRQWSALLAAMNERRHRHHGLTADAASALIGTMVAGVSFCGDFPALEADPFKRADISH